MIISIIDHRIETKKKSEKKIIEKEYFKLATYNITHLSEASIQTFTLHILDQQRMYSDPMP